MSESFAVPILAPGLGHASWQLKTTQIGAKLMVMCECMRAWVCDFGGGGVRECAGRVGTDSVWQHKLGLD